MSVNGVCQSCGAIAPIEWFLSEAEHRKLSGIVAELPREVAPLVYHYLALFKSDSGRAMLAKKAVRLVTELKGLVVAGHVQVDRKVARPCPPRIWALAIEQMIERRDRLNLPMPNHNYLKTIAWDLVETEDRSRENGQASRQISRTVHSPQHIAAMLSPIDAYIQGHRDDKPSDEEMNVWKKTRLEEL